MKSINFSDKKPSLLTFPSKPLTIYSFPRIIELRENEKMILLKDIEVEA